MEKVETGEINFNQFVPNVTGQFSNLNLKEHPQPPKSPEKVNSSPNLPMGPRPTYPLPPSKRALPDIPIRNQTASTSSPNIYGTPSAPIYNNQPPVNSNAFNSNTVNSNTANSNTNNSSSNFYMTGLSWPLFM